MLFYQNNMKNILSWYSSQATFIRAFVVFVSTIAIAAVLFLIISLSMYHKAVVFMKPYNVSDTILAKQITQMKKPSLLPESSFDVLKMEQKIINIRKKHHYELAVLIFKNYYAVLIISMVLSCLGGLILFVLINMGWANAGITLQSLFLSIAICLTFFGFFPSVFQQEKNLNGNIASYMNYSKAEMNILQQLSTLSDPSFAILKQTDSVSGITRNLLDTMMYYKAADSFIYVNAAKINSLMNYVLNIDAKEVKGVTDIARLLSNYQAGETDSTKLK